MNKPFYSVHLESSVKVDFFSEGNRYYGDFHRVKIIAVATIPLIVASLPEDLQFAAEGYAGSVKYEKSLERMGVATNDLEATTLVLVHDFIETVSRYLEKENFAEALLRREVAIKKKRNHFIPL